MDFLNIVVNKHVLLINKILYYLICKIPLLARAPGLTARPSARATIGYLVYNLSSRAHGLVAVQAKFRSKITS